MRTSRRTRYFQATSLVALALGQLALSSPYPALACVVAIEPGTTEAQLEAQRMQVADLVFEGVAASSSEVLTVTTDPSGAVIGRGGHTDWTFDVERMVKGAAEDNVTVTSDYSSVSLNDCSARFTAGNRYRVYATATAGGGFATSYATGTRELPLVVTPPPTRLSPADPVAGVVRFTG